MRAFVFIRDPKDLTTEEQAELVLICQRSATAEMSYQLTQQFMSMLRLRRGQEFETWLQAVEASHISELSRFAHSLRKRQGGRCGWTDPLLQQWASRGAGPEA
jgi:transposase